MAWIKRHLYFVVGGILSLVLLGGTGFYIFQNWSRNSDNTTQLNDLYSKLQQINQSPQRPGINNTNTTLAKEQEQQVMDWMSSASSCFTPIPSLPPASANGPISTADYAQALRQTIDLLQHEAESASVTLPPQYDFSFAAQRSRVRFSGALEPLATQLGEVKVISEILFAARVNALDSIQRVRVSDDDMQGAQSDYIDDRTVTNDLAVIRPYVVTFRCFTPELAKVLSGFASSPYPFVVKSVSAQPASMAATTTADGSGNMQGGTQSPDQPPQQQPQPVAPVSGKGGLPVVLQEQLLRFTLEVDIVKLLPKS